MIKFIDVSLNNIGKNIFIITLDGFCCKWFD